MYHTKQIIKFAFILLCSSQMACAALTNNLAKMKEKPGKVGTTGMRVNVGLYTQQYVPFFGDMNLKMDDTTPRVKIEKDATNYRGRNMAGEISEETLAFVTQLHSNVIAELSNHLDILTIDELNQHAEFEKFPNWIHSFNKGVHISLPPYRYPLMTNAPVQQVFADLGMVAGINMAYSFVAFHEQGGVEAVDLSNKGAAPRSIGIVLYLMGRDSGGGIMLNQTFLGKSNPTALPAMGDLINVTEATTHYDEAGKALVEKIRAHFAEAS